MHPLNVEIAQFDISNYDEVFALWQKCEGIGLSDADSRESINKYLSRNRGMSFIATFSGRIVGVILAGHDGRRGYIHHLAVHPDFRRKGLAHCLVDRSIEMLCESGIRKCHLFLFNDNTLGLAFWENIGWTHRLDISVVSKQIEPVR